MMLIGRTLADPATYRRLVYLLLGLRFPVALALTELGDVRGSDVLAVGALGVGAEVASAALLGAATGIAPSGLDDPDLRSIALWKLEGYTTEEIAGRLSCVPRTVERRLRVIRSLWNEEEVS